MRIYNFDDTPDRLGSDCLKWDLYGPGVIPLWVADMDFVSPEPVIQALKEKVEHGVFGYPTGLGGDARELPRLRSAIIGRMADRYNWEIKPDDIVFVPGVVTGFNLANHAFIPDGQGVLIQTPVYPPILQSAETTGKLFQSMELDRNEAGFYEIDWDKFSESITPETGIFILCNPHNPVGKAFSKAELERTAELCLREGVLICSDEIHCDLVYERYKHIPIASIDREVAESTITLMAPSKTYNLPGLQCSFAIIQNEKLRNQYMSARRGIVPWVNMMGLVAAEAAYTEGEEWFKQLMVYLKANRDYLIEFFQSELPAVSMAEPQATFLGWLDCRSAGLPDNPYEFFLKKARVAFNNGVSFGKGGEGFLRINFGCSRLLLEKALSRMKKAVARIS